MYKLTLSIHKRDRNRTYCMDISETQKCIYSMNISEDQVSQKMLCDEEVFLTATEEQCDFLVDATEPEKITTTTVTVLSHKGTKSHH